jgi:hypothetical protein
VPRWGTLSNTSVLVKAKCSQARWPSVRMPVSSKKATGAAAIRSAITGSTLSMIRATTTETGLTVAAVLDTNAYPTGVRISDAQMKTVPVQRYAFHGEWNYVLHPGPVTENLQNKTISL